MKLFYVLVFLLSFSFNNILNAQIFVTFQVDVSNYIDTHQIYSGGIRIGGDFGTVAGKNNGQNMPSWTPSDPLCAMSNKGNNVWEITVEFPSNKIGSSFPFKFVNNDWWSSLSDTTDNEGVTATSGIRIDGCGEGQSSNRLFTIPSESGAYLWCWDQCYQCDGAAPFLAVEERVGQKIKVYPNPVEDILFVQTHGLLPNSIMIYDALGRLFSLDLIDSNKISVKDLDPGIYYVQIEINGVLYLSKILKQ